MQAFVATIYPLGNLIRSFYIADLFDVAVIAILIYSALFLFKQTRSLLILIGLGIVAIIYAAAQVFDLYLTSFVLESFFSVFFLVLVIIFQEELRRFFEFIAALSTRQTRTQQLSANSPAITELLHAIEYLASQKVGALVVIRGRENIDRLVDGGRVLGSVISENLIASIFDTASPGHDGAMIIYKNRITQFGTHLPLSTNFKEIGRHGTRHSAALGISERSDAFAIAVSEEQGTVSVAYRGKLETVKDIRDLDQKLNIFLRSLASEHAYTFWENLIRKNSLEKIIAVVMAGFLWFFVVYRADIIQRDFEVPISYQNVPEGLIIEETKPSTLTVTLESRGKSAFERLDDNMLNATIDGSSITSGVNSISVDESSITKLGTPFSVINIEPSTVKVTVQRYAAVSVPVEAALTGQPANGFRIASVKVTPPAASLLVPENMQTPAKISTEPIAIDEARETITTETRLVLPKNIRLEKPDITTLSVTVIIERK